MRDADRDRWGAEPFTRVALDEVFHSESIRWYRSRFYERNPGHDTERSEQDFLQDWGFIVREGGELLPTRAAVALFGSLRGINTLMDRAILDLQFLSHRRSGQADGAPWIDRFWSEQNIIQTWQQLLAKYLFFMPKSFSGVDPRTLERRDAPAGFRVFREAAMNLLIHQDYGDNSRTALIQFFSDGVYFWNAGDSFSDIENLMQPGEKEVRNPAIAGAMQRIALCERAGTGLRMIDREWTKLGHPKPSYDSDREYKTFSLFLPELEFTPDPETVTPTGQAEDRVGLEIDPEALTDQVLDLVLVLADGEMSRKELQDGLDLTHRMSFMRTHLRPALEQGLIEYTIPESPRDPRQRYKLSLFGNSVWRELISGSLQWVAAFAEPRFWESHRSC